MDLGLAGLRGLGIGLAGMARIGLAELGGESGDGMRFNGDGQEWSRTLTLYHYLIFSELTII